jgi:hypothetical protein
MNAPQVISNYESLQVLTSQMRDAATRGEWDKLLGLEHECLVYVATMKQTDSVSTLDEPARQRKIGLIKKIVIVPKHGWRNCKTSYVAITKKGACSTPTLPGTNHTAK